MAAAADGPAPAAQLHAAAAGPGRAPSSVLVTASAQAVLGQVSPLVAVPLADRQLDADLSALWVLLTAYLVFFMQVWSAAELTCGHLQCSLS